MNNHEPASPPMMSSPSPGPAPQSAGKRAPLSRDQRTIVVNGILSIVLVIVILQLWLLVATMNAYLGGDEGVIWPAAIVSAGLLALNLGLLWYVYAAEG